MTKILLHSCNIFMLFIHISCSSYSEAMWLYLFNSIRMAMFLKKSFESIAQVICFPLVYTWFEHNCCHRILNKIDFSFLSWRFSICSINFILFRKLMVVIVHNSIKCFLPNNYISFTSFFINKCDYPVAMFIWL